MSKIETLLPKCCAGAVIALGHVQHSVQTVRVACETKIGGRIRRCLADSLQLAGTFVIRSRLQVLRRPRFADRLAIADLFRKRERFFRFRQRVRRIADREITAAERSGACAAYHLLPFSVARNGLRQIIFRRVEIAAQHVQLAQRIQNHRHFSAALVDLFRQRQRALQALPGRGPTVRSE